MGVSCKFLPRSLITVAARLRYYRTALAPIASVIISMISAPMAREAVAAGLGALST
jgi:hypothetical protein